MLRKRDSPLTKSALTRIEGTVVAAKSKMGSKEKVEDVNPGKQR